MFGAFLILLLGTITGISFLVAVMIIQDMRADGAPKRVEKRTIDKLSLGVVEVTGSVQKRSVTLSSPMSRQDCVQFTLCIDGKAPGAPDWAREAEYSDSVPFTVNDGTGLVTIDRCYPWQPERRAVRVVDELPPAVQGEVTARYGDGAVPNCAEYRMTETLLAPADVVNVVLSVYSLAPAKYDVVRVSSFGAAVNKVSKVPALFAALIIGTIALTCVLAVVW